MVNYHVVAKHKVDNSIVDFEIVETDGGYNLVMISMGFEEIINPEPKDKKFLNNCIKAQYTIMEVWNF